MADTTGLIPDLTPGTPEAGDMVEFVDVSDTTHSPEGTSKRFDPTTLGGGGLTYETPQTTSFTAQVGKAYPCQPVAANIVVTFPSAGLNAGDKFRLFVDTQSPNAGSFAQAPGYCVEPATATSIRSDSYTQATTGGNEWSQWLDGEYVTFEYSGSTWIPVEDGRIPHSAEASLAGNTTTNSAATWTPVGYDTQDRSTGNILDTTNELFECKRANRYLCQQNVRSVNALTDGQYYGARWHDGTNPRGVFLIDVGGTTNPRVIAAATLNMSANGEITPQFISEQLNRGADTTSFAQVTELLE